MKCFRTNLGRLCLFAAVGACADGSNLAADVGGEGIADGDVDGVGDATEDDSGPCLPGRTLCGTECVDLTSDPENCGRCGLACAADLVCNEGGCASTCSGTLTRCGGSCVDLATNPDHCGACDYGCPGAANADGTCSRGVCGLACRSGWQDLDGAPGCEYACTFLAPEELCNGRDDDCDGAIDEGFLCAMGSSESCTTAAGLPGLRSCVAGCIWGACSATAEACNGLDDDGDGACDEDFGCCRGLVEACTLSCGSMGTRTCSASCAWGDCIPSAETCNGLDDDCNGTVDGPDVCHTCVGGTTAQYAASAPASCSAAVPCDACLNVGGTGTTWEDMHYCRSMGGGPYRYVTTTDVLPYCNDPSDFCAAGSTASCGGTTAWCVATGVWHDNPSSRPEVCNGLDDDCNGTVDGPDVCHVCVGGTTARYAASVPASCSADVSCDACLNVGGTGMTWEDMYYCRSMVGGPYRYVTTTDVLPYCDDMADRCGITRCGGETFWCDGAGSWLPDRPSGC
ncbi:MAG: hypothetical protein JXB32_13160 [Deltaproteobacteria bacterium]|nr:hypothetical protein [Deltaproteobacteria bacterium]